MSDWDRLIRFSKLASAMYPDLTPKDRRAQMERIAAGEGRRLGGANLLSHEARSHVSPLGGLAVQQKKENSK
jgi:hypothetical protein